MQHLEMVSRISRPIDQNENGPARLISRQPDADWKKGMIPVRTVLSVTKLPWERLLAAILADQSLYSIVGIAMTAVMGRRDWLLLNRPSRVQGPSKRLIQLQDFGRWEYGIHCVGDRVFDSGSRFSIGATGADDIGQPW
jgi:hypothetical protein